MVILLPGKAIGAQANAIWTVYKRLKDSESFSLVELAREFKMPQRALEEALQACRFQAGGFIAEAFWVEKGEILLTPRHRRALKGDFI
jgi:hypothetical protein